MKFLQSWLADYIEDKIPTGEDFVRGISTQAFEVEEFYKIEDERHKTQAEIPQEDYVYDLNILPNRAHDALGHYYLAKEVAAIFNLKLKKTLVELENFKKGLVIKKTNDAFIKISDTKSCTRFIVAKVNDIEVKASPDFIKYRLEAIGQKSINNIVDITNYVQFSYNKPMHAYDANLVSGFLEASYAKEAESISTLDEKELKLDKETLVIRDNKNILALAGIKGGKYSGITENTKSIIIESANFNPTLIRKTAQKYNLKTEASKRFENGLANELSELGMLETLKLLAKYGGAEVHFGEILDNFPSQKVSEWQYKVSVSLTDINDLLGTSLSQNEVAEILKRLNFQYRYISTLENMQALIPQVLRAKYKNPSSMRMDAPECFSCSSLVSYLYTGVYMPSISIDKYLFTRDKGQAIKSKKDLRFGDLVFINTGQIKKTGIYYEGREYKKGERVATGVDHLGVYLGEEKILHASSDLENGTEIESLEKFLSRGEFVGYGRVLEDLEETKFIVEIPKERLDLRIKEDIIEEIGRIYGLNNLVAKMPELKKLGERNKLQKKENVVRNLLEGLGFSEVITYSLRSQGEIRILKSVAKDKNYLRNNLRVGLQATLEKNIFNLPLLGEVDEVVSEIRIFEFGKCFTKNEEGKVREWLSLGIAIEDGGKNKNYEKVKNAILEQLQEKLGVKNINFQETKNLRGKINILEIDFEQLLENSLREITEEEAELSFHFKKDRQYKTFAKTPFIVRDIAFYGPAEMKVEEMRNLIQENISSLVTRITLFDEFEKEGKKSLAFRLIYQDPNRTLTDEEVNQATALIYQALQKRGLEIR